MYRPMCFVAALSLAACLSADPELQPRCDVGDVAIAPQCEDGVIAYTSGRWSANEELWMQEAVSRWNAFAGAQIISLQPGDRNGCTISSFELPPGTLAMVDPRRRDIKIDRMQVAYASGWDWDASKRVRAQRSDLFIAVVMHQLGHSLGFTHEDGGLNFVNAGGEFGAADRAQCIELGWCEK